MAIFQFDFDYLKKYHAQLEPFLVEIFKADKSAYECFLNDEFTSQGRDWSDEIKWLVSLIESVEYSTRLKK